MTLLDALLLGLLQGITEFFPVSSSAHLKILKHFLGIEATTEAHVIFDLVCHLGTLIALLLFLSQELRALKKEHFTRFFLALLPLPPAYFLLKPLRVWGSDIHLLGFFLMGTSLILFLGEWLRFSFKKQPSLKEVVIIGAAQALALIPGLSRSGSTISCARALGWEPKEAVRFSFLLAIPTVIGGNCLELLKIATSSGPMGPFPWMTYLVGFIASCGMGMVTVQLGFRLLERGCFKPFAWYCLILGTAMSLYFYG